MLPTLRVPTRDTGKERLRKDTTAVGKHTGRGNAGSEAALKDTARVREDAVKLTVSASETFRLLAITNLVLHNRNRSEEKNNHLILG